MAAILGPFMVGSITDLLGNYTLFLVSSFFFIAALVFMFLVKRGEVKLSEEEQAAKEKAIQEL
jgi:cyanate permease